MNKKSKSEQKKVAVLFSSGLDSTYLVWKNLKEGNKVLPFYIEIENNINKVKVEKQNILLLFEKFRNEFGSQIEHPEIILSLTVNRAWNGFKFQQVPIWLFALNYVRDMEVDEIQIGYVSNDDAISYTDEIRQTYENQRWFFHNEKLKTKLTFPLTKEKKEQMLKEFRHTEYVKHVFSCENPQIVDEKYIKTEDIYGWKKDFIGDHFVKYENCGDCVPCKKILNDFDLRHLYINYVNEDFKRIYLKKLEEEYKYNFGVQELKAEVKAVEKVAVDSIDVKTIIQSGSVTGRDVEGKTLLTDTDGETIAYSKSAEEELLSDDVEEVVNTEEINDRKTITVRPMTGAEYNRKREVEKLLTKKEPWDVRTMKDSDDEHNLKMMKA